MHLKAHPASQTDPLPEIPTPATPVSAFSYPVPSHPLSSLRRPQLGPMPLRPRRMVDLQLIHHLVIHPLTLTSIPISPSNSRTRPRRIPMLTPPLQQRHRLGLQLARLPIDPHARGSHVRRRRISSMPDDEECDEQGNQPDGRNSPNHATDDGCHGGAFGPGRRGRGGSRGGGGADLSCG